MRKVLILGGAGYIGSVTSAQFKDRGYIPIVVDNLSQGSKNIVKDVKLYRLDINKENLQYVFDKEGSIDGIIHFAGLIQVGESMKDPSLYIRSNICTGVDILDFMKENNIKNIVFSSSAGVYGNPRRVPIKEGDIKKPINVYGFTKYSYEKILKFYDQIFRIKSVSLRYFNAAGASDKYKIGETHKKETHLIPLIIKSILNNNEFTVYGNTYDTKDGSCIRDYIHVNDLANAHVLALEYLISNKKSNIFNLGANKGYSIFEIIREVEKVTGEKVNFSIGDKREGDPSILIADFSKAKNTLLWEPKYSITDIISSAYSYHKNYEN
ncbi:UDP-glucose 4-epimerase GalE [Patescibacteria group bacterium]|nr:UDP-glucose 4-epimerase GalE [Patescibacteria group bacterium]